MQFSADAFEGIAAGTITLTIRAWTRPQVKVGGRYNVGPTRIEVDTIDLVPFAAITSADLRRCGSRNREALRALIAHARPVDDDTIVYRIAFRAVGERDVPKPLDVTDTVVAATIAKLVAIDDRSSFGPWTATVLAMIGAQPGVVSTILAEQLDRERFEFKRDVRNLKALGLTESLETGYRLTALGEAVLDDLDHPAAPVVG